MFYASFQFLGGGGGGSNGLGEFLNDHKIAYVREIFQEYSALMSTKYEPLIWEKFNFKNRPRLNSFVDNEQIHFAESDATLVTSSI